MSATQPEVTLGEHLPWVNMTLDYTERLVELIPDELLDFRPVDPLGHHMFSLAEIAMHLADERRLFARQLSGEGGGVFIDDGWEIPNGDPNADPHEWNFRPHSGKASILASLRAGRSELQPWLDQPLSAMNDVAPGSRVEFEKNVARMREKGEDTAAVERRGAATINRVLFGLACHESGHRGALQTLLRLQGVDARGEG